MARKNSSAVSEPKQQPESIAETRQNRQRRVTSILKYAGLFVAGGSGLGIVHQLGRATIE